jgi:radical SAM protein with 4Fe4S-binding SPASM domain
MPDEVVEKSIKFAKPWAKKDLKICWYGGEPLLAWDTIKKWTPILHSEIPGSNCSITTNGSLVTDEVMAFMDEHKMGMLFSIDGPPWVHNRTRVFAGGKPSWEKMPVKEIIEWRPDTEIAWQLSPYSMPTTDDLDWMIDFGFHQINFNVNWLTEWDLEAQEKLRDFMYYAIRLAIISRRGGRPKFSTNWFSRIEKLVRGAGTRDEKPCGTSLGMISVTPEGYLYPSQEMGFMVFEPGKAKGTPEWYRLGNVYNDPVWDYDKFERVFALKNDEMVPPPGRNCNSCPVRSISFGGCHCRYVGQVNNDPSYRYNVMPGWCQAINATGTGGLLAFAREGYITVRQNADKVGTSATKSVPHRPLSIVDLDKKLDTILTKLEEK